MKCHFLESMVDLSTLKFPTYGYEKMKIKEGFVKASSLLMLIVFLQGCASYSSGPQVPPDKRQVTIIESMPGKTKDELFSKAMEWVSLSYNSGKHVVDLTDSKFGTIVGNGMTTFEWDSIIGAGCAHNSKYKMRISVKDEKVRIMYSGLIGTFPPCGMGGPNWQPLTSKVHVNSVLNKLSAEGQTLIAYLKDSKNSDDW